MNWKVRVLAVGGAWILIPWTWSIVAWQLRLRRGDVSEDGGEDEAGPPAAGAPAPS